MQQLAYHPPTAIAKLQHADPKLAVLIDRVGKFSLGLQSYKSPFDSLLKAIVYQQLSGRAAAAIYQRVCELFPRNRPTPNLILQISEPMLRGAGLSWAKVAALKDLAEKTLQGMVPSNRILDDLDDEEIIRRLTQVRGVGQWTVEMLLIFGQGRPDILPTNDLGIRKGFMYTFQRPKLPSPAYIKTQGKRWQPYRSVASWYLWRAVDLEN